MHLELTAGEMAVLVGGLTTAQRSLEVELDNPNYIESQREAMRAGIANVDALLDKVERVLQDEVGS